MGLCHVLVAITLLAPRVRPGVERWPIKVSAPRRGKAKVVRLEDLVKLPEPPDCRKNDARYQSRRIPAFDNSQELREGDLVSTTGYLHLVAGEPDGDYHVQISASATSGDHCLVVEIPHSDPRFGAASALQPRLAAVREFIKTRLLQGREPSSRGSVMRHEVYVRVTGQLFFDDAHIGDAEPRGKRGMKAATLWEIHPVTAIEFARKPR